MRHGLSSQTLRHALALFSRLANVPNIFCSEPRRTVDPQEVNQTLSGKACCTWPPARNSAVGWAFAAAFLILAIVIHIPGVAALDTVLVRRASGSGLEGVGWLMTWVAEIGHRRVMIYIV